MHSFKLASLIAVLTAFVFLSNDISKVHAEEPEFGIDNLITGAIEGSSTGFPIPRFVSLKSSKANLRVGPSYDHKVEWIYVRSGFPVEIIQEFEDWRKVRDVEGVEGWLHKALLSARRNAIVKPSGGGSFAFVYQANDIPSKITAKLQSGVQASIEECDGEWCRVVGEGYKGWVKARELWGVYPNEIVE